MRRGNGPRRRGARRVRPAVAPAQVPQLDAGFDTDVALLNHLLHLEHVGIAAYTAGTPLLRPGHDQGRQAVPERRALPRRRAGRPDPRGRSQADQAGAELRPRAIRARAEEVLALLHEVEQAQITAYLAALPRLAPASVKQSVASILANDAQHVTVVRAALGQPAVPSAFVTGRE